MDLTHEIISTSNAGLAWAFHVSPDLCTNPAHFENFLRLSSLSDQNDGMSTTHLLLDSAGAIAGFVALRATSLLSDDSNGNRLVHPALEIAELAVDSAHIHQGVGHELVNLSFAIASALRESIGIKSVVLCSTEKSVSFYEHMRFKKLSEIYEVLHDGQNNDCQPMFINLNYNKLA